MDARIKWVENALFTGETGSGHAIVIDGPPTSAAATSACGRWN